MTDSYTVVRSPVYNPEADFDTLERRHVYTTVTPNDDKQILWTEETDRLWNEFHTMQRKDLDGMTQKEDT